MYWNLNLTVPAPLWNFSEDYLKVAKVNTVVSVRKDIINSKEKKEIFSKSHSPPYSFLC